MSIEAVTAQDIDATGLTCPEPVMLLHAAIRQLSAGQCVRLRATDPSTERDVGNFCRFLGHRLLQADREGGQFIYLIEKQC